MKKIIKATAAMAAAGLSLGLIAGCGSGDSNADKGHVYFLSMKVEQADQIRELADNFTAETGIEVDVATASSDTYEQTLKSELAKSEAPTVFDVDNNDFLNWTDYYADMSDTNMYKDLTKQDYAMKNGDEIGAVPYVMERYGIIYNKALLQKYFDANWSSVKDVETINNFDTLRTVADEIQAHKDDLGIKGAFTSAGFDTSSIKRFGDQLAHVPVYYEYRDQGVTQLPATISDTYIPNFKKILTCISLIRPRRPASFRAPPWMTPIRNSRLARPCSCRTARGVTRRSRIRTYLTRTWACCRFILALKARRRPA